jgi:hypothetical protein
MAISDLKNQDLFEDGLPPLEAKFIDDQAEVSDNRRVAVRYLRDDIILILKQYSLLKWQILAQSKLLDISSKGAYICSSTRLDINKKIMLVFAFKDGKQFQTKGTIIHNHPKNTFCYGVVFKKMEHDLGDHLIESQEQLIFK